MSYCEEIKRLRFENCRLKKQVTELEKEVLMLRNACKKGITKEEYNPIYYRINKLKRENEDLKGYIFGDEDSLKAKLAYLLNNC